MKDENLEISKPDDQEVEVYSYGDYLNFSDDAQVEIILDMVYDTNSAPEKSHQMVSGDLFGFKSSHFRESSSSIYLGPTDVILPLPNIIAGKSSNTVVQADICVISENEKIKKAGCCGAPDLEVEVIGPRSARKDLTVKRAVYAASKVKEYWLVFPKGNVVNQYVLIEDTLCIQGDGAIKSHVFPTLSIDLKEVFQDLHEN